MKAGAESLVLDDVMDALLAWQRSEPGDQHNPAVRRLGRFLRALDGAEGRAEHAYNAVYEAFKGWASDLVGLTAPRGCEVPGAYEVLLDRIAEKLGQPVRRRRNRR